MYSGSTPEPATRSFTASRDHFNPPGGTTILTYTDTPEAFAANKSNVEVICMGSNSEDITVGDPTIGADAVTWTVEIPGNLDRTAKNYQFICQLKDDPSRRVGDVTVSVVAATASIYVPVESVAVSPKTASVAAGSTTALSVAVAPRDVSRYAANWSSSDESVATVDDNGVVTGVKAGTATITVTASSSITNEGGQEVTVAKSDTCVVTVTGGSGPVTPTHQHAWSETWEHDADHHWHNCTAAGCPITENGLKDGAGAHEYDNDRDTTCNVCGYVRTVSSGGGSSGSGSSSSGSSNKGDKDDKKPTTTTPAENKPTTTTTTDKATGTVTETTKNTDGSQTVVETKADGTVTTTETDAAGNKTETVENPDGSSVLTVAQTDGASATVTTTTEGRTEAAVSLPAETVAAAQQSGEAVSLPIPAVRAARNTEAAPAVTVTTGSTAPVKVEIPAANPTPGTVAVLVGADGAETIIKTSIATGSGVAVSLPDGATVKIIDNSKSFADVSADNWAGDAVSFVTARELFSGTSEDSFTPDAPMTRAMLVTVLARFDGADTEGGETWYAKGVEWAVANGVSDGTNPDGSITREQLAVMLWRYAGSPAAGSSLEGFTDAGEISDYAQDAMAWAVASGVMGGFGDGQLGPQGQATRAQVAQMLKNFIER